MYTGLIIFLVLARLAVFFAWKESRCRCCGAGWCVEYLEETTTTDSGVPLDDVSRQYCKHCHAFTEERRPLDSCDIIRIGPIYEERRPW